MNELISKFRILPAALALTSAFSISLIAQETVSNVSYSMKVSIDPWSGDIAVQGTVKFVNGVMGD